MMRSKTCWGNSICVAAGAATWKDCLTYRGRNQRVISSMILTLALAAHTSTRVANGLPLIVVVNSHVSPSLPIWHARKCTALNIASTSEFDQMQRQTRINDADNNNNNNNNNNNEGESISFNVLTPLDGRQHNDFPNNNAFETPSLETWKRRLITKEDKFQIHKITSILFMVASSVIMAGGALTKFSTIPSWLHSITLLLVCSGWVQLYTSLIMTQQFRTRRDEKAAFLVTAIGSSMTNFLALWFSPFCPKVFLHHPIVPNVVVGLNTLFLWLPTWQFMAQPRDTIQNRQERIPTPESSSTSRITSSSPSRISLTKLRDTFAYFVQIPLINLAASRMIYQLLAHGRDFFLSSWVLTGRPAQNLANIYYSMVFLSMASNYVALTATLRDKSLISQSTESGIMAMLGAVSVFLVSRTLY